MTGGAVLDASSTKVIAGASAKGAELVTLVIQNDRRPIDLAPYIANPDRNFVFSVLSSDAAGNSSGPRWWGLAWNVHQHRARARQQPQISTPPTVAANPSSAVGGQELAATETSNALDHITMLDPLPP